MTLGENTKAVGLAKVLLAQALYVGLSSEMSFCANRNQCNYTGQDRYLELLMRLLLCSSAQFASEMFLLEGFLLELL